VRSNLMTQSAIFVLMKIPNPQIKSFFALFVIQLSTKSVTGEIFYSQFRQMIGIAKDVRF